MHGGAVEAGLGRRRVGARRGEAFVDVGQRGLGVEAERVERAHVVEHGREVLLHARPLVVGERDAGQQRDVLDVRVIHRHR